jgi:hypothetical protein
VTPIFTKPLLPNEPRITNEAIQQDLTDKYLMPALAELEAFFLALRAEVDAMLQPQQPIKLGKPYPLGQCLEITHAVQKRLQKVDASNLYGIAVTGHAALLAFLRAGGILRQVWGDLRGQFFQNAFLIGTLYVDVSNDTVVPTKPKVEILPFARSQLTPIRDYRHFNMIAERYWKHQVFPNHVLPELAPFFPVVHVNPQGRVRFHDPTRYMIAMTRSTGFQASEEVLRSPAMQADLFALVAEGLQGAKLKIARNPEQGRADALDHCRMYRAKRWHKSDRQKDFILDIVHGVNRHLAKLLVQISIPALGGQTSAGTRTKDAAAVQSTLPSTSSYAALSKERHAGKRWQRHSSYHFAAHDALAPLATQELPQAMMAMPIAFIISGAAFDLVAVQGLAPGRNAFVASDGRWLAGYLPLVYSAYPFKLVSADNGEQVLCVDENTHLITDGPTGERFFDEDGKPAQTVKDVLDSLAQQQAHRNATAGICAVLQKHKLIQPWRITVQAGGKTQNIEGLYRIDEAALNTLLPDAFIELRDSGALAAAYCQLLSMQHLQKLGQMLQSG